MLTHLTRLGFIAALCAAALGAGAPVWAQSVSLAGMLGHKALLVVNGGAPKTVAPGETHQEVKVVSTSGQQAVVEVGGKRQTLRVGEAPVSVGSIRRTNGTRIVLTAGSGGHFQKQGSINGSAVQFMVDTGATTIGLSESDAKRIGLNLAAAQRVGVGTANGSVPGYLVKLNSVRIDDVEVYDVDAVVTQASMPYVLLGNSFLTRFQMQRTNDQMVLERRY